MKYLFTVMYLHHLQMITYFRFFVSGSEDMTARVYSLNPMKDFTPITLSGHRNMIVSSFFEDKSLDVSLHFFNDLINHKVQ